MPQVGRADLVAAVPTGAVALQAGVGTLGIEDRLTDRKQLFLRKFQFGNALGDFVGSQCRNNEQAKTDKPH